MDQDNTGRHCALSTCRQRDFLPFKCDACNRQYCLDHRLYSSHGCLESGGRDVRAIICPLCAESVQFKEGENVNTTFAAHCATSCTPELRAERTHKSRCPAPGCREKLVGSNRTQCARCRREFCLAHRYADTHACRSGGGGSLTSAARGGAGAAPLAATSSASSAVAGRLGAFTSSIASSVAASLAPPAPSRTESAAHTRSVPPPQQLSATERLKRSAAARQRAQPLLPAASAAAAGGVIVIDDESSGAGGAPSGGGGSRDSDGAEERCPQCSRICSDVLSLINHVETSHGRRGPEARPAAAAASGGAAKPPGTSDACSVS